jgi:hypothetical protein
MAGFSYSGAIYFKASAKDKCIIEIVEFNCVSSRKLSLMEICYKFLTVHNISWKIWSGSLSWIMFPQR